jgi:hypothetical protein
VHTPAWNAASTLSPTIDITVEKKLSEVLSFQEFITVGEATFSILFWDLYQSQLRTTSGRYPIFLESEQLIFQIRYLTDISNDNLIMRTIEQWQHQGISKGIYQQYIEKLATIWPNIKKGDRLAMLMQKDKSVFYFNDQYIGAINDDVFGQLFVNIWLGDSTSEPSLRAQLLGEESNE